LGVKAIRQRLEGDRKLAVSPAGSLVALFANSPFAGLNIDFEPADDLGRSIVLTR